MSTRLLRRILAGYVLLLLPAAWLAARYDRYAIDGDAVAYMDIADLLHAHRWADAVNGYWHPLYPALLWLAQVVFHPTRMTELGAYYTLNFFVFLIQIGAMLLFVRGLVQLRNRLSTAQPLLSLPALQLLGVSLLVIATMRELSLGKVRTDGLLQALILAGLADVMESLAAESMFAAVAWAASMGLCLGFAYLTKSFAFVLMLLSVALMMLFRFFVQRKGLRWTVAPALAALVVFAAVAGPYMAALSHQKGRFDFGDSGNLNYVWYVSGTEKMHLEPSMTDSFGSATVHLVHPERQLMEAPGVYSYKALANGTYPPWFDTTYFNERITPKFSLRRLAQRDARNVVLILRYLLNHPEPLLLLLVLLVAGGGSLQGANRFAWPSLVLGLLMWAIYAMVNVEERYVTVAYLAILLPLFASVRAREGVETEPSSAVRTASMLVVLFACLQLGELYRQDAVKRRDELVAGQVPAWRDHDQYGAAEGLMKLGIHPGDEIACIGEDACLIDNYWARLAGVRILTEIYEPTHEHLIDVLDTMPNREAALATVRAEGAKVLVGGFDPGEMNATHPAAAGWVRLGETRFYALPMMANRPDSR